MAKHVVVLMGGWASEREVSLASGKGCADALRRAGYQVTTIDVGRDLAERLKAVKPDVVFNALHGRFGEDGTVQGVLEVNGNSLHAFGCVGLSISNGQTPVQSNV